MVAKTAPVAAEGAQAQVVLHAHQAEQLAALGHQHHALVDALGHVVVAQQRLAGVGHLALAGQQADQRRHQGGLAGAIGADQADDLAFLQVQVEVAYRLDLAVVDRQVAHIQQATHSTPPR